MTSRSFWRSSADDYVRKHPEGSALLVRVKPGDPETSILRAGDQVRVVTQIAGASPAAHSK